MSAHLDKQHRTLGALLCATILLAASARADDWPQWRGPTRDAQWREQGVVKKFARPKLKIAWSAPISSGYSGPTVSGGLVYVTDRIREPKQQERVLCFDEKTGKPAWTFAYDCSYVGVGYEAGPRAAVSIDHGLAYALGSMGHLHCLDAKTGKLIWQHDLMEEYKAEMPGWGITASPLVDGKLVIVQVGGKPGACLVALDKQTGKEVWHAVDDDASYSAPIIIEQAGKRVLVAWTGHNVVGVDPASGKVYWQHPFEISRMIISVATPVYDSGRIFVSSFYDGSLMLALDPKKLAVTQAWRKVGPDEQHTESLHSMIGTPYIDGNYVYGVDSYGELRCLNAETGERIWESQKATPRDRWSTIHMVRHGAETWMFNERGELLITHLTPKGYEEISRAKLIEPTLDQLPRKGGGVTWSHPAFANRHVFARSDKELVSADLSEGGGN